MSPPCQASSWAFSRDRQHFGVPRHLLGMEWIASDVTLGAELAERAVAGDRAAFARIVATHHADHVACQCATSRDIPGALSQTRVPGSWHALRPGAISAEPILGRPSRRPKLRVRRGSRNPR